MRLRWLTPWFLLFLSDAMFFPTIYLCNGITKGLFKRENLILIDLVFNTVGRSCGPPLARAVMHHCSRNIYALTQVSAIAIAWLITDRAVWRGERCCTSP